MACQFNKHRFSLIISFLVLFFVIACGTTAAPDSEPTANAPESQTEPAATPTEAANAAPSGATPTASSQQTPESLRQPSRLGLLTSARKNWGHLWATLGWWATPKSSSILLPASPRPC